MTPIKIQNIKSELSTCGEEQTTPTCICFSYKKGCLSNATACPDPDVPPS